MAQSLAVGAGKRLMSTETRADGGLELLHVRRTGDWQQDADVWRAPVEPDSAQFLDLAHCAS